MPREKKVDAPLPTEGTISMARVVSIQPYGAFVEIDGCTTHALVHISQIAPRRIETVDEVVSVGDRVHVKVLAEEQQSVKAAATRRSNGLIPVAQELLTPVQTWGR